MVQQNKKIKSGEFNTFFIAYFIVSRCIPTLLFKISPARLSVPGEIKA